jgi:hypothetical protein
LIDDGGISIGRGSKFSTQLEGSNYILAPNSTGYNYS